MLQERAGERCLPRFPRPQACPNAHRDEETLCWPYERFKDVHFPVAVLDVPHILKQIDELLMTPEEAMEEAARTGQLDWLDELLVEYDCSVSNPFVAPAANGQLNIVRVLVFELKNDDEEMDPEYWGALKMAVVAAAENGHVEVVENLLPELIPFLIEKTNKMYEVLSTAQEALEGAASNGHLDMVRFNIEHARANEYASTLPAWSTFDALSRAILGGHCDVVEFLFNLDDLEWDLLKAVEAAISVGENALANKIYDVYPLTTKNGNLLVDLACEGTVDPVKYLYDSGYDDALLIGDAFVGAAKCGNTCVVKFLLDTGRMPSAAFDKGFETAAGSRRSNIDTVTFLYNKKARIPQAITKSFEIAQDIRITKLLYENERLPNEAIIAAFRKATRCGSTSGFSTSQMVDIVLFLAEHECIPSKDISEAFKIASKSSRGTDVLKFLHKDTRVSSEALGEAFATLASKGHLDMMNSLYDEQRISPEALFKAFKGAILVFPIVCDIVKYLSGSTVPAEIKHEAFVTAARYNHKRVLQILAEIMTADWPLCVLKESLYAADDSKVKNFIRTIVCNLVFGENE